jgi:hypothetical protein
MEGFAPRVATQIPRCRDENGVPHVEAATWNERSMPGYMHAVDRPTVYLRAVASGQATERIANKPGCRGGYPASPAGLYRDLARVPQFARRTARHSIGTAKATTAWDAGRTLPMWVTGFRPRPREPVGFAYRKAARFAGLTIGEQENERLLRN